MLSFADEIESSTTLDHDESEEDEDDAEISGDGLYPYQPADFVESTKGK